jgi:hypothetical protein
MLLFGQKQRGRQVMDYAFWFWILVAFLAGRWLPRKARKLRFGRKSNGYLPNETLHAPTGARSAEGRCHGSDGSQIT